jgi:hypothetical protein
MHIKYIIIIFPIIFILSCNKPIEKKNVHPVERKKSVLKIDTLQFIGANPEKVGYVPDSLTAVKIGEAELLSVYGIIDSIQLPIIAKLKRQNVWKMYVLPSKLIKIQRDSIWIVQTSPLPPGMDGGALYSYIAKKDGRVMIIYGTQ